MSNTPHVPMDDAHLKNYAANAARGSKAEGTVSGRVLSRALKRDLDRIRRAREALDLWSTGQSALPGAAEWLLDNHYLALREGGRAREALRGGGPLRRTGSGDAILQRCAQSALWAVPDLDQSRLALYLEGFQSVCPLTERELSLFVPALAGALVERLAGLCGDVSAFKENRVPPEEMGPIFAALRALSGTEWSSLLEGASRVERVLNQDPSGHYPHMDEDTRRRYRQRVCKLARKYRMEEGQTARQAIDLAQKGDKLVFTLDEFRLEPFSALCAREKYTKRLVLMPGDIPRFSLRLAKNEDPLRAARQVVEDYAQALEI